MKTFILTFKFGNPLEFQGKDLNDIIFRYSLGRFLPDLREWEEVGAREGAD